MRQNIRKEGKRKYSEMNEHEIDINFTFFEVQIKPNHQTDQLQKP